jgi:glyoxylase-like metal-dependent hydrolase (beta-lactamase superfamily II)
MKFGIFSNIPSPIELVVPDPIIMVVKQSGDVRIHTFISSFAYDHIANATHIIESKNCLVLIDGQFLTPYAQGFRAYADSLNKPIERLYLTHRHPDHWFGIGAAFADGINVYALPETIDFLKQHGEDSRLDHLGRFGSLAPDRLVIPQHKAQLGEEIIDGIKYSFAKAVDTEIDYHLTIRLPDLKVNIVQDLIYSGTHLYVTKDIKHWIQLLDEMLVSDDEIFLPGHGWPADKLEVAKNKEYLVAAGQAICSGATSETFKEFMIQSYPERKCPAIFDTYLPRLFGGARDF